MKSFRNFDLAKFVVGAAVTIASIAMNAVAGQAGLDAASVERLDALHRSPDAAGALIYRGTVLARRQPSGAPLFTYERRVGDSQHGLASAHLTRAPNGETIIAEQAEFTPDYRLRRFTATNKQLGLSGAVVLSDDGRRLDYQVLENGKLSTATEDVSDPVVTGPTLHGFILNRSKALAAGDVVRVRMIVMAQKTTYGFDIRQDAQADGQSSFSVTPSNWLVRLMVAPLVVTFDGSTKQLLRYEGLVPPMQTVDGSLKELEARVEYTMVAPSYR